MDLMTVLKLDTNNKNKIEQIKEEIDEERERFNDMHQWMNDVAESKSKKRIETISNDK